MANRDSDFRRSVRFSIMPERTSDDMPKTAIRAMRSCLRFPKALVPNSGFIKKYNADFDTFLDRKWGDGTVRSEFVEDFVPKEDKVSMHAVGKHRKSFLVVTRITIRKFARCFKNILKAGE